MKYIKKPIVIDAFQIRGNSVVPLMQFVESLGDDFEQWFNFIDGGADGARLEVKTLEGTSYNVIQGDYVIRGIKGEYYPCKPDIFEATYEIIDTLKPVTSK